MIVRTHSPSSLLQITQEQNSSKVFQSSTSIEVARIVKDKT